MCKRVGREGGMPSGGRGERSMTFGIEVKENEGAKGGRKNHSFLSIFSGKSCDARGAAAFAARWDGSGGGRAAAALI